jgi:hypothetical protein
MYLDTLIIKKICKNVSGVCILVKKIKKKQKIENIYKIKQIVLKILDKC